MKYAICELSYIISFQNPEYNSIPKRHFIYGDLFQIENIENSFYKIIINENEFSFISKKQLRLISKKEYQFYISSKKSITTDTFSSVIIDDFVKILPLGSILYNYDGLVINMFDYKVNYFNNALLLNNKITNNQIENLLKKFINTPYVVGGSTLFGIDILGLISFLLKLKCLDPIYTFYDLRNNFKRVLLLKNSHFGDIIEWGDAKNTVYSIVLNNNKTLYIDGTIKLGNYSILGIQSSEKDGSVFINKIKNIFRLF